jgi:hypothetical protein
VRKLAAQPYQGENKTNRPAGSSNAHTQIECFFAKTARGDVLPIALARLLKNVHLPDRYIPLLVLSQWDAVPVYSLPCCTHASLLNSATGSSLVSKSGIITRMKLQGESGVFRHAPDPQSAWTRRQRIQHFSV